MQTVGRMRRLLFGGFVFAIALRARAVGNNEGNQPATPPADARETLAAEMPGRSGRAQFLEPGADPDNRLLRPFYQHLAGDQRDFWSSARELAKPESLPAFLPFAGFSGLLIGEDNWISRQVPVGQVRRSQQVSNYAAYSLAGAAAGSFVFGSLTGNDHSRETGFLSSEAALNSTLVAYAFKEATRRQRPYQGSGKFLAGGSSFPSEHAALAWSVASVAAHEYPGPLTKLFAYGLASAVTVTRVTAKEHFSSDVVLGSALGWYLGRQVFRAHHDPELGGAAWGDLSEDEAAEKPARAPQAMGSPFVELDSWVYPALERLAAAGLLKTAFLGLKPWTRMECAELTLEAGENLQRTDESGSDLRDFEARLEQEFTYESRLLDGGRNSTAALESVYARGVLASGPVLTDGYHFGQTLAYDFGRPFRRGRNGQTGGSFYAALGPAAFYVRAEFQHAPSAPPLSGAVQNFIATADLVPEPPAGPFPAVNRARLLDAYVALNVGRGWQLSFGPQSLSWAPGPGGSLLWSTNAPSVPMARLLQRDVTLPGFLKFLGPARIDNFFGWLRGHGFIPHPYIYGNKINFKPLPGLELGFGRSVIIGGTGGDPLTPDNFLLSFFGRVRNSYDSVPGSSHSGFDWTFHVPKVRNYLIFYGEMYANDDPVPWFNPPKNPYRPGIYLTRFPRLPKLDLHIEATNSESPGQPHNIGNLNYWNHEYRDGYTNDGNLIGNTVGRMGRTIQSWFTYWISPVTTLQFTYKHNSVSPDFVPKGGYWQDYSVRHEMYLHSGLYVKSQLQFERISRYPLLFPGPEHNITAVVEFGFYPHSRSGQ